MCNMENRRYLSAQQDNDHKLCSKDDIHCTFSNSCSFTSKSWKSLCVLVQQFGKLEVTLSLKQVTEFSLTQDLLYKTTTGMEKIITKHHFELNLNFQYV